MRSAALVENFQEAIRSRSALTGNQNVTFGIHGQLISTNRARITPGVTAMPLPGGPDDLTNVGVARRPMQFFDDFRRASDQHGRVTRPSARDLVGDWSTDDLLTGL